MGWLPEPLRTGRFVVVSVVEPCLVRVARRLLARPRGGVSVWTNAQGETTTWQESAWFPDSPWEAFPVYDADVSFPLRFAIDCDVVPCRYVSFSVTGRCVPWARTVHSFEVHVSEVSPSACNLDDSVLSVPVPLRLLSYDIECVGRTAEGIHDVLFPRSATDPIVLITAFEWQVGTALGCGTLHFFTCTGVPSVPCSDLHYETKSGTVLDFGSREVRRHAYETEEGMLRGWVRFLRERSPDVVTGYNINHFDNVYVVERCEVYGIPVDVSRVAGRATPVRESRFCTRAFGDVVRRSWEVHGVVFMDMFVVASLNQYKTRSLQLGDVCFEKLGVHKGDQPYRLLPYSWENQLPRLITYGLGDAVLPMLLLVDLHNLELFQEMAAQTGVEINLLLLRGQRLRAAVQWRKLAFRASPRMFYPTNADDRLGVGSFLDDVESDHGPAFQGGYVFAPRATFYGKTDVALLKRLRGCPNGDDCIRVLETWANVQPEQADEEQTFVPVFDFVGLCACPHEK